MHIQQNFVCLYLQRLNIENSTAKHIDDNLQTSL